MNKQERQNILFILSSIPALLLIIVVAVTFSTISYASALNNSDLGPSTTQTPPQIHLSSQPIFKERVVTHTIPIDQRRSQLFLSGNGTFFPINSTQKINTTSNGSAIVFSDQSGNYTASGMEILTTQEGSGQSAKESFYEITLFNNPKNTFKGYIIARMETNSTGTLEPLNGMVLVGTVEFQTDGSRVITMWQWQE